RSNAAAVPCECVVRVVAAKFLRPSQTARFLLLSSKPIQAALIIRFERPARKCGSTIRFRMRVRLFVAAQHLKFARAAAAPLFDLVEYRSRGLSADRSRLWQ